MKKTLKKLNRVGRTILLFVGIVWGLSEINENLSLDSLPSAVMAQIQKGEIQMVKDSVKCCKICKKGKACGDSCINKQLECHQPPGCACDAE